MVSPSVQASHRSEENEQGEAPVLELEACQFFLDDMKARAELSAMKAREATNSVKEVLKMADGRRKALEAKSEARLHQDTQANEEMMADIRKKIQAGKDAVQKAHARANKYAEAAKKFRLQAQKVDGSLEESSQLFAPPSLSSFTPPPRGKELHTPHVGKSFIQGSSFNSSSTWEGDSDAESCTSDAHSSTTEGGEQL